MSNLNYQTADRHFEVIDGWAAGLSSERQAIAKNCTPKAVHKNDAFAGEGTTSPLRPGSIVLEENVAGDLVATHPLTTANITLDVDKQPPKQLWMVVGGNTDEESDGAAFNSVVCLRGNFTVRTSLVDGTPALLDKLSVANAASGTGAQLVHQGGTNFGQLKVASAGEVVVGVVTGIEDVVGTALKVYTVEISL